MDKNPISHLQELAQIRFKQLPTYNIIFEKSGTHQNLFRMTVKCNNYYAEGEGSSKKEARLKAAMKMLEFLNNNENQLSQPISSNNNQVPKSIATKQPSPEMPLIMHKINYIGMLQEYAAQGAIPLPEYDNTNKSGPEHNPIFTVVCKFNGLTEEAQGPTKKEAKALAAENMYNRITSVDSIKPLIDPQYKLNEYFNTISNSMSKMKVYEENQASMKQSIERAKEEYPKRSDRPIFKSSTKNITCDKYHTFLKDSFNSDKRSLVINKLQSIIKASKNFHGDIGDMITILKKTLAILNINLKENCKAERNSIIYNLQLETNPVISEIGYGNSVSQVKMNTIIQIAETLTIMLE